MLELAILGLLKDQELHGYELKKRLADTVGSGSVSFGSIYPARGRLERGGAVSVVATPGVAGRGKKVYSITDRGERLFEELLVTDAGVGDDERSFNLRLAFARHLSREARIGMMERRRAYLLERLARTRIAVRHSWGRLDAYTRSLMEHGNETTERDISWLDRLIAGERAGASDAAADTSRAEPPQPARFEPANSDPSAGSPAATAAPWGALSPPTMPVRPRTGPLVPAPAHPRGGTIQ
ncbi:MAG: helix-turn-helix transcriptional regulator [Acidimicrobiales bacterium]